MQLLTIGNRTINVDHAIEIEDHGERIDVVYVVALATAQRVAVSFEGDEAQALRRWLQRNAEDVSGLDAENTGEALNDPQPYTSPRR